MLTDKNLQEFKVKLEERKVQILKNLKDTSEELNDIRGLELNDEADYAESSSRTTIDSAILVQQRKELNEIELALGKIVSRTYGICEMCEEPINIKRLEVKNFARYCIACREINEKEQQ